MEGIKETDWKRLRDLKPIVLDRFCTRVLSEVERVCADSTATAHQRYLAVYELIQEQDKELGYMFDGLSRSNAAMKLFLMHRAGLLTEDEIAAFSEDIRSTLAKIS